MVFTDQLGMSFYEQREKPNFVRSNCAPLAVPKEYHQYYKHFDAFWDKLNEVRVQMEQNPELGKHFTGKFTEGKMDGNGEF